MTLDLAAIFGTEPTDVIAPVVVDSVVDDPVRDDPNEPDESTLPTAEGTEHFSIYVDSPDCDWPEFIPGYHVDVRQPTRLRPLCTPHKDGATE